MKKSSHPKTCGNSKPSLRDIEQCKILAKLIGLWNKYPQMRFCQLLENIVATHSGKNHCMFQVTDKELLEIIQEFEKRMEKQK